MHLASFCVWTACAVVAFASVARADDDVTAKPDDADSASWPSVEVNIRRVTGLPTLEARSVNGWQRTPCVPPCMLRLSPSTDYRVSGIGVVDSDPFRLPIGAPRVRVDVSPGNPLARHLGTTFTIGGLAFAAAGSAILLWPSERHALGTTTTTTAVGVGFLTMGVLVAAVGVALRIVSDTSVHVRAEHSPEVAR